MSQSVPTTVRQFVRYEELSGFTNIRGLAGILEAVLGGANGFGTTGPTGANGTATNTGATGPAGPTGSFGPTGAAGSATSTGAIGPTGSVGVNGSTGPTGAAGVGSTGTAGVTGAVGPTGTAGPTGAAGVGSTGTAGVTGAVGPTGTAGPTGAAGTGATGTAGVTGAIGSTGTAGATGPTGTAGVGSTGPTGTPGISTGPTGAGHTGPTGSQGITGPTGSGSASVTGSANIATIVAGPTANIQFAPSMIFVSYQTPAVGNMGVPASVPVTSIATSGFSPNFSVTLAGAAGSQTATITNSVVTAGGRTGSYRLMPVLVNVSFIQSAGTTDPISSTSDLTWSNNVMSGNTKYNYSTIAGTPTLNIPIQWQNGIQTTGGLYTGNADGNIYMLMRFTLVFDRSIY